MVRCPGHLATTLAEFNELWDVLYPQEKTRIVHLLVKRYLGVDSLGYLSLEGMLTLSKHPKESFCTACFSGKYPTRINRRSGKLTLG